MSISLIKVDQEGELTVEFDILHSQVTQRFRTDVTGSKTFDIYKDKRLMGLCRDLFHAVRHRLEAPPRDRKRVRCGRCSTARCCREYNVLVSMEDIDRIRGGTSRRDFTRRYTEPAVDWTGDYRYQLKTVSDSLGDKCVFLKPDGRGGMRCAIYVRRPEICRDFDMNACEDFEEIRPKRRKTSRR